MPPTDSQDQTANDRYEILGRIAVGGMAEIYLAKDVPHDRDIVLKRLMPGLQSDAEFVRMFYDEANIAARLQHPNIVTIHELGELDGSLFIAMELLNGVNLRELQVRLQDSGRTLPSGLGIVIATGALSALDYAHRFTDQFDRSLKVVHRDVSPQNIIVTFDGVTKLVDFGVAKAEGRLHQTRAGLIKGKFAYMSPEQVSGAPLDGRSDIFALGEVVYELLLKRHPFYARVEMDMLRAVLDDTPPHPTSLDAQFPPALARIILRALQKAPEDRYGTAGLMKKDLEKFASDNGISLNQSLLARFLQDLFRDRIERMNDARARGDVDAVVKAMRVLDAAPVPRAPVSTPMVAPDQPSRYDKADAPAQAVEVSGPADPADTGRFVAHSEATKPASPAPRYEKSDVFSIPIPNKPTVKHTPAVLDEDDEELPTVMGELSADDMERLRKAAAQVRAGNEAPTKSPVGEPAQRSETVPPTAAKASAPSAPMPPTSGPSVPLQESPADVPDPAEQHSPAEPPDPTVPMSQNSNVPITPRSQTVVANEQHSEPSDRGSLAFFIAGVIALIGAVIYAAYLFTGAQKP